MPPPTAQVPLQQPSVQQPPPPAAAPPAARTPANDQTDLVRKAQNDLRQQKQPSSGRNSANRSINNATTSLENVQRAMGELHIRENGRGRGPSIRAGDMSIPTDEFDFASSNARFNKVHTTDDSESDQQVAEDASGKSTEKDGAYNPKASFFDSLGSSQANNEPIPYGGRGGGRGGRRGGFKREEERQKNVATFGEPGGGPGLLGPGAYVPGWRGNRRGQGRGGRRGMPRPNNVGSQ
jgi:protein LSM14